MKISLFIRPAEQAALREWLTAEIVGGKVTLAERQSINNLLVRLLGKLPPLPSPTRLRAPRSKLTHHHD